MWCQEQLARLESRAPTATVTNYLIEKLGVNRLVALGITNDLDNILAVSGAMAPERGPYQVWHKAVSYLEPAGKPIGKCRMVDVALTLVGPADAASGGKPDMHPRRILRICQEAIRQGAVLSYEDICLLLGLERTTVQAYPGTEAHGLPGTHPRRRDQIEPKPDTQTDCRPDVPVRCLQLDIVRRAKHSLQRVNAYLEAFIRVALALHNGVDQVLIPKVCKMSPLLADQYLQIYAEVQADEAMRKRLETWVSRLEAPKKGGHQ